MECNISTNSNKKVVELSNNNAQYYSNLAKIASKDASQSQLEAEKFAMKAQDYYENLCNTKLVRFEEVTEGELEE